MNKHPIYFQNAYSNFSLSLTSIVKLIVEKVRGCEIGEHILQTFFFSKQVHPIHRNSWCNPYIFFVDISVQNTIFRKYYLANELYISILSFLLSYENNLRACHWNPEEPVQEPILFASCPSLVSEPFYLINLKKNVLVTVVLDSAFLKLCSEWAVSRLN